MLLSKGHAYFIEGSWYVLVSVSFKDGKTYMNCICDNANNIYSHEPALVTEWFDSRRIGYERPKNSRPIPYQVIAEVLIGQHDDRFDHWL